MFSVKSHVVNVFGFAGYYEPYHSYLMDSTSASEWTEVCSGRRLYFQKQERAGWPVGRSLPAPELEWLCVPLLGLGGACP